MKVLVIEDDPGIVEVVSLCFQLRWSGTTVISAANGRKGVDLVEIESPDVLSSISACRIWTATRY
jgi:DNA-binding response OmpR family regulator